MKSCACAISIVLTETKWEKFRRTKIYAKTTDFERYDICTEQCEGQYNLAIFWALSINSTYTFFRCQIDEKSFNKTFQEDAELTLYSICNSLNARMLTIMSLFIHFKMLRKRFEEYILNLKYAWNIIDRKHAPISWRNWRKEQCIYIVWSRKTVINKQKLISVCFFLCL